MDRIKEAQKVTWVGFAVNFFLMVIKMMAGIFGKSTALIADGIHSLSDFVTDLLVIVFIGISGKEKDEDHKYGHGKYETFATLLISFALLIVGIGICWSGLTKVMEVIQGKILEQPSWMALGAAILSIIFKEIIFHYTRITGRKIQSNAVIANAWHHRSDAFSSIGTTLGVSGAIFLGASWRVLDPIAGIIVSVFIGKVAIELGIPSINELVEKSLSNETEKDIIHIIESHPDVIFQHNLKTRKIGNIIAIDVHIKLDKQISFIKSHDVATEIEAGLRTKYGEKTITNIHTEPYDKEE